MIGPSGCGKSTLVRCINRMHEEIPGARAEGAVMLDDTDIYGPAIDAVDGAPRRSAWSSRSPTRSRRCRSSTTSPPGLRLSGTPRASTSRTGSSGRCAAPACGTRSRTASAAPGIGLSGGQQQRLCIARTIAVEPEVILMDEPCSALDPIATLKIEELIAELKERFTIVIVTHNMQQAARVADTTAFMLDGELVEHAPTDEDLHQPGRPPDRGVRHREVRLSGCPSTARASTSATSSSALEEAGARRPRHRRRAARPRRSRRSSTRTSSSPTIVIADDDRVDGRYLEVHQGILSLLALQAPVAGDLRLVAALLHVIKHVERMGDQCVNIAKLIPLSGHEPPVQRGDPGPASCGWARAARSEVVQAKAAFADPRRRPGRGPRPPGPRDQPPQPRGLPLAIEVGDDPDTREWAMHMMLVARALERIGDNAVDIGEQTAFVVTGLFREFSDRPGRRHAGRLRSRPSVHPIRPRAPESSHPPAWV